MTAIPTLWPKRRAISSWWPRPHGTGSLSPHATLAGPYGPVHHQRVAADEPAPAIGLVELLAEERIAGERLGLERLVEDAFDEPARMVHEVLADVAGGIREAVGKPFRLRREQQARRADAVAADDDHARELLLQVAAAIEVEHARSPARRRRRVISFTRAHVVSRAPGLRAPSASRRRRPTPSPSAGSRSCSVPRLSQPVRPS